MTLNNSVALTGLLPNSNIILFNKKIHDWSGKFSHNMGKLGLKGLRILKIQFLVLILFSPLHRFGEKATCSTYLIYYCVQTFYSDWIIMHLFGQLCITVIKSLCASA